MITSILCFSSFFHISFFFVYIVLAWTKCDVNFRCKYMFFFSSLTNYCDVEFIINA